MNKECNLPSLLAIGRGICEVVDGLNLRDGGTTLACPECCGALSLEDTVCLFFKPPARTVKEELFLTTAVYRGCTLLKLFMRHGVSFDNSY